MRSVSSPKHVKYFTNLPLQASRSSQKCNYPELWVIGLFRTAQEAGKLSSSSVHMHGRM